MAVAPTQILNEFGHHFGWDAPPVIYRAPGRVNLIGEHTDYNLGYVLPVALEMACYVAIAPLRDNILRIRSQDLDAKFSISVDELLHAQPQDAWHDYVIGVAQQLIKAGVDLSGASLLIRSEVPTGSGLSSSAALEVGSAFALLNGRSMDPLEIATLAQRAETQFVGVPVGIMDQYASVFGRENAAIQIDCRSLGHEYVTLPTDVSVIAVNSMVKHELGSSAYRERVAECKAAVEALQKTDPDIKSLRDVTLDVFVKVQETVPPIPRQRARHVISDTQRVLDFAKAAAANDLTEMGRLFVASHRSMQYDYEISCEEIDFLVDTAIKIPGVYGARMTGGGFGGCTVNLVKPDAVRAFGDQLTAAYSQQYGLTPAFYDCKPANGAGLYYR
ncbi:MAG: galactokinase [Acidobacteriaceae bacterium]|nr:galactokinase [Acidobacteriaceae bacterium]